MLDLSSKIGEKVCIKFEKLEEALSKNLCYSSIGWFIKGTHIYIKIKFNNRLTEEFFKSLNRYPDKYREDYWQFVNVTLYKFYGNLEEIDGNYILMVDYIKK